MEKNKHIIISACGKDQPGIVSEVSRIITNYNANISESRMMRLGGDFTMMILATMPFDKINPFKNELNEIEKLTFQIHETKPKTEGNSKNRKEANILLSGSDNEGIVFSLAEKLTEHNINILEMSTDLINAPMSGANLFILKALISYNELQLLDINKDLAELSEELDVDISIE